jgi:uncharacterized protein YaeQ
MAIAATLYRFEVELSDVDRNVYAQLELRPAQHPSETLPYMLTRVLAYCLSYEEGIAFTRGLAVADEPALWIKDLQGNLRAWIEVGAPSAERLHKASKAVGRVVVFTHHGAEALQKALRGKKLHRADEIELYAIDAELLAALEPLIERSNSWTVVRNEGELYVTARGKTLTARVERRSLTDVPS